MEFLVVICSDRRTCLMGQDYKLVTEYNHAFSLAE